MTARQENKSENRARGRAEMEDGRGQASDKSS